MKKITAFGFGVAVGLYIGSILSKIEISRVDVYNMIPEEKYSENDIRNIVRAVYDEEEY